MIFTGKSPWARGRPAVEPDLQNTLLNAYFEEDYFQKLPAQEKPISNELHFCDLILHAEKAPVQNPGDCDFRLLRKRNPLSYFGSEARVGSLDMPSNSKPCLTSPQLGERTPRISKVSTPTERIAPAQVPCHNLSIPTREPVLSFGSVERQVRIMSCHHG